MHKRERQDRLRSIISSIPVSSQSELAAFLKKDGYGATQASISRDLEELGISKIGGYYSLREKPRTNGFVEGISLATAGDNLIVGKCSSGMASAITVRIDAERIPEVVGTIADDDTIFIAVENRDQQQSAINKIRAMFGQGVLQ